MKPYTRIYAYIRVYEKKAHVSLQGLRAPFRVGRRKRKREGQLFRTRGPLFCKNIPRELMPKREREHIYAYIRVYMRICIYAYICVYIRALQRYRYASSY
jgi:hypothetical protein